MERYEINKNVLDFETRLNDIYKSLEIDSLKKEITELDKKISDSSFWLDTQEAQKTINRLNSIKGYVNDYNSFSDRLEDIKTLIELMDETGEEVNELEEEINSFMHDFEEFEISILLNGEYDSLNAILELHPGAGGTESMDWALMLFRMYSRFAQRRGFKVEILDYQPGEEAGIKSVTMLIKGKNAYGYLKSERGVHRLVRISPFDSGARRHTSFVSADVAPEFDDKIQIDIDENDLKIDVYHSSGAGGQSVNTTDSAVRITHKPSGIVVTCQNERSQIKNRERAMQVLKSKLLQEEIRKKEEELRKIKGEQMDIGFGSQIRSYVFHPYSMVKDHRTNYEVGNTNSVMDGYLDGFINAYLKQQVKMS